MDWFRWHHGSVTDPKFQLVARKSGSSVAEVIGVWATLLEAASMNAERGRHGALDFEALDCALGLDDGKAEEIYQLMTARGLVDPKTESISAWAKRQPARERDDDNSYERVKAFRAKKRDETPCNASETPSNATKRLEEIRGDKSKEEEKGGGSACASAPEPRQQSPDGSPPPFLPEYRKFIETERPDLDAAVVFANFSEHFPPEKHTPANWRKWVRREHPGPVGQPGASGPPTASDPDSRASVEALGVSLGLGKWVELNERWAPYAARVKAVATQGVAA